MIRGTIRKSVGGIYRLEVPQLDMTVHGDNLETIKRRADAWLRKTAGPEPEAQLEVLAIGRLNPDAPQFAQITSRWDDPALMEAVRLRRGTVCPKCHRRHGR